MKTVTHWWGWRVPALGVAALVLLGSGLAAGLLASNALAGSGGSTLFACVGERSGAMRLVDGADDCLRGEELVSWNTQGPAGPQGPKGDTGAAGQQGATGQTGATGSQGLIGLEGPPGDKGDTGQQGDPGVANYRVETSPVVFSMVPQESRGVIHVCLDGGKVLSGGVRVPNGIQIESSFIDDDNGDVFFATLRNITDQTVELDGSTAFVSVACADVETAELE